MSPEQLDAIRARAEAATPGPWSHQVEDDEWQDEFLITGTDRPGSSFEGWGPPLIAECVPQVANAEFIAHAREDVPALLAEVERLRRGRNIWRAERDRLAATVDRVREMADTAPPLMTKSGYVAGIVSASALRAAIEGTDS